jgi:hypothetical protein
MDGDLFEATAQILQAKGGAQKDALKAQIAGYGACNDLSGAVVTCESLLARCVTGGVDHSAIPLLCR